MGSDRPKVRAAGGISARARQRATQSFAGYRPVNNWGDGDLPAPWAEGDVVRIPDGAIVDDDTAAWILRYYDGDEPRPSDLRDDLPGVYVISYVTSIDEGDAWYCRVASADGRYGSDRLHVAWAARSTWDEDSDRMAAFDLVDTLDGDGLRRRAEMINGGWAFTPPPTCPTCGQRTYR